MTFKKPNHNRASHEQHCCCEHDDCSAAEVVAEATAECCSADTCCSAPASNATENCCSTEDHDSDDGCCSVNEPSAKQDNKSCCDEQLLIAEVDKARKESAMLKDMLLRQQAESDNQRKGYQRELDNAYKRHQRELESANKFAIDKLLVDLVPIKDSLDIGVNTGKENPDKGESILKGLELIQQMLETTLKKHHVEQVFPLGEKFDPSQHEALSTVHSDEYASGDIVDVFQSGFILNGRPIRPARVIVSRGSPQQVLSEEN